ncbi:hypothetical protein HETIRDRAFT_321430 [Heterobasidion irregulare TC 32-1]|uniref:Uncharacterized protein n=1 Tax=Heterobasidion irregulare (strain TC 32-1) TaxID=747525 RepID=W4K0Y0_HETIT|nr:uncharacterized protein HETIRDRAFT_321430 [Heterobasidion irregulare TC 32-1]ETW79488.1 hypothetical protein HETIRDRAFT_321430 [Heterobasidion irregulare TC 32-1]
MDIGGGAGGLRGSANVSWRLDAYFWRVFSGASATNSKRIHCPRLISHGPLINQTFPYLKRGRLRRYAVSAWEKV